MTLENSNHNENIKLGKVDLTPLSTQN